MLDNEKTGIYTAYFFILAVLLRLFYIHIFLHFNGEIRSDHTSGFQSIIEYGGLYYKDHFGELIPHHRILPGYPYFITLIFKIFGTYNFVAVAIAQAILGGLTAVIIGLSAGTINRRYTIGAMGLAAVWPNLVIHVPRVGDHLLFLFFFAFGIYFCLRAIQNSKPMVFSSLAGFCFGLACLTRPTLVYFPVFIFPLFLLIFGVMLKFSLFRAIRVASIIPLVMLLILAPRFIDNYTHYGHLKLTSQTGNFALRWALPCLTSKDFCNDRSLHIEITDKLVEERLKSRPDIDRKNPMDYDAIRSEVALEMLMGLELSNFAEGMVRGIGVNLFNSAIQHASYQLGLPIYPSGGRYSSIAETISEQPILEEKYLMTWLWRTAIILLFITRVIQVIGAGYGLKTNSMRVASLFLIAVVSYMLLLHGPVANAEYRIPLEPSFIILTTIGAYLCYAGVRSAFAVMAVRNKSGLQP